MRAWTSCGNTVLRQTTAAKDMKSSTDLRVDTQQMSWVTTRVGVVVTKDCLSDSDIQSRYCHLQKSLTEPFLSGSPHHIIKFCSWAQSAYKLRRSYFFLFPLIWL